LASARFSRSDRPPRSAIAMRRRVRPRIAFKTPTRSTIRSAVTAFSSAASSSVRSSTATGLSRMTATTPSTRP
jgi:uncharacterized membrane protein